MSKDLPLSQYPEFDNPWRRLPWVLPAAFFLWGALLGGFGFLMGQMAEHPEPSVAIEAQIIELPSPVRSVAVPKQPRHKLAKSTPPKLPAPVPPANQLTSRPQSVDRPMGQTETLSTPGVSLPETNLLSGDKTLSAGIQSGAKIKAKIPPQTSGESITPPQFGAAYLNNPKPSYPFSARRMGMDGTVMLKVLVSREGTVLKIDVAHSSGHEILDNAAAQAVRNWRFIPARKGDSPVDEWVQVPVAFHLKK